MSAPFIRNASITSPSSAWLTSSDLTKSPPPNSAVSRPLNVTCRAVFLSSARASTSFSGTPTQRALPIAPLVSCPPVTRGEKRPRLLPEHWLTATYSIGLNWVRSSAAVNWNGLPAALPPILMTCCVAVDGRRNAGVVVPNEEGIVRRDQPVVEDLERRLELRRARGEHDHRSLFREDRHVAFAVDDRQVDGRGLREGGPAERGKTRGGQRACATGDEPATQATDAVCHGASSEIVGVLGAPRW